MLQRLKITKPIIADIRGEIAEELKAEEEKLSLNLDLGEIYLDLENIEKASHHLNQTKNHIHESRSQVYQPELYINLAKLNWMRNEKKSAEKLFLTALDKALNLNRWEMVWKAHHLLGKLHLASYEIEKAYKELENAGMVLRKISLEIKDPDLKQSYLDEKQKKELLSDIKRVTQILEGKPAQVVT